ncbi:MAG: type II toxin-antitoxin system VapB family antitoxin [Myxococcota bacterium]
MKRTNLVLDEKLLHDATILFGLKTYSDVVNKALAEAVKTFKIRSITSHFGTDVWSGKLEEMREDKVVQP